MTPQERQLIDDLFDRLAKLESAKRDPEAMSAIMQGLRAAPNAVYALVQTALVQDEALKRADMRIQELEAVAGQQHQSGGFLDLDARCDLRAEPVDAVRCPTSARPIWRQFGRRPAGLEHRPGAAAEPGARIRTISRATRQPQPPMAARSSSRPFGGGGGSFLGTAAAAAAGVVGGSLLAGSIRSMMGGGGNQQGVRRHRQAIAAAIEDRRPWSDQSGGDLAREAGINDIGSSSRRADNNDNDSGSRQGFFDQALA